MRKVTLWILLISIYLNLRFEVCLEELPNLNVLLLRLSFIHFLATARYVSEGGRHFS